VKRVWGLVQAELDKRTAPADQLALLRGLLLFQAETYPIRQDYQALTSLNDALGQPKSAERLKADADRLRAVLKGRFDAVINKPQSSASPIDKSSGDAAALAKMSDAEKLAKSAEWHHGVSKDEDERREHLAHLLVHLDADGAWQKRVAVVVGLRAYVRAISAQVQRLGDMVTAVERLIPEDQASYQRHETQLRNQAIRNAERAKAVADIRAALTEQKTTQDDALSRRATQLKELAALLNKVKGEVDELLVRQTGIEKQLYEVQREVALTLEEVYRLEALLTATERERYNLPPQGGETPNPK
jgi:chromosome segregation ATPase